MIDNSKTTRIKLLKNVLLMTTIIALVGHARVTHAARLNVSTVETIKTGSDFYERATSGPTLEMGEWAQIPMPPVEDRMQGVHALLLPNGKILLANGSSNRNVVIAGEIQNGIDTRLYSVINNVGLFDPTDNSFLRIPAPSVPADPNKNNDLFCSGQLHLPDGNVLFAGGTQSYYGQEQFQGSKAMQVFDWRTNTWFDAGEGKDGHWYPSLFPLENGQLAVISGLSFNSKSNVSPWVEFYDPTQPAATAWKSVDISTKPNSPWNTSLGNRKVDGLQLYPRIYPLQNNQFLITHDGAGWGAASGSETNRTYLMTVTFDASGDPDIRFDHGPTRVEDNRIYSTVVQEPNTGDILIFGGQKGPKADNSNDYGPGPWNRNDVEVVADMERFTYDANQPGKGTWSMVKNFMGNTPEDVRIMLFSTLLPTKQLLIINGGNYAYHRPLFYPILLSADNSAPGNYRLKQMNQALEPRMYHNISLLLPDGRVLSAGGNASRAAVKLRNDEVDEILLNTYKDPNGQYHVDEPGEYGLPAEIWQMEIFSPPYLFIEGPRPEITLTNPPMNQDQKPALVFGGGYTLEVTHATAGASLVLIKLGASTHAWDSGQRLIELEITQSVGSTVDFKAPELNHHNVPGYYMLFYVNDKGQPSVSKIVQLTSNI